MYPPREFYNPTDCVVWKLNKAIYGLRSSPSAWAETPCGSPSTTWTNPQRSRAEQIHDSNKRLLPTGVCRRPTNYLDNNRQWTTSSTRFNNIYYCDQREHYTPATLCPFSGANITNKGGHFEISLSNGYIDKLLADNNMSTCNPAAAPGTAFL